MATSKRWLPREGFNADIIRDLVKNTAFAPSLTVPLLLLASYTAKGREIADLRPTTLKALKTLVGLGLAGWVNNWLSRRTLNNWTTDRYVWNKEVAVVTGGSDGIGRRIATLLALKGLKVAVLDVQPLQYSAHPNIAFFQCNVTSPDAVSKAAGEVREKFGEPTILVNNAGLLRGKTLLATTEADVRTTFEVNTLAHYWLTREFLPHMVTKNHGMVVTVASQASFVVTPTMVDYGASKSAALSFHEGLAAELKARYDAPKVRTIVMTQSFTRTHLTDVLAPEDTWMNPYLHPDTVAEMVVDQILKGESAYLTVPRVAGIIAGNIRSLPYWFQHSLRLSLDKLTKRSGEKWG